jgi:hypothetical protein
MTKTACSATNIVSAGRTPLQQSTGNTSHYGDRKLKSVLVTIACNRKQNGTQLFRSSRVLYSSGDELCWMNVISFSVLSSSEYLSMCSYLKLLIRILYNEVFTTEFRA